MPYTLTRDTNGTEDEFVIRSPEGRILAAVQFWDDPDTDAAAEAESDATLIVAALNAYPRIKAAVIVPVRDKFSLGRTVITAAAEAELSPRAVRAALRRHASGKWGIVCKEDREENERSLREGGRLFSAHGSSDERFWIITEASRSVTTVLLPQEY